MSRALVVRRTAAADNRKETDGRSHRASTNTHRKCNRNASRQSHKRRHVCVVSVTLLLNCVCEATELCVALWAADGDVVA